MSTGNAGQPPAPTSFSMWPYARNRTLLTVRKQQVVLPLTPSESQAVLDGVSPEIAPTESDGPDRRRAVALLQTLSSVAAAAVPSLPPTSERPAPGRVLEADPDLIAAVGRDFLRVAFTVDEVHTLDDTPADLGEHTLQITVCAEFDLDLLVARDERARAADTRQASFFLTDDGAGYGPYVAGPDDPGVVDLVGRWITAAEDADAMRATLGPPIRAVRALPSPLHLMSLIAGFAADVDDWSAEHPCLGYWHHVHDTQQAGIARHPVLPLPAGPADRPTPATGPAPAHSGIGLGSVLDETTGVVLGLRPIVFDSVMPRGIRYVESQTADISRLAPWASNIYNAGSSWHSDADARWGATGEAIERYCGNVVPAGVRRCSYDQLRRQGEKAVDPADLVLFSERQYEQRGLPFVPFTRELVTSWVHGVSLATDEETWLPASLVFVNWNSGDSIFDPPTNPAYYPGIAAAPDRDLALCNALEEVVERDAAMVWWLSGAQIGATHGPVHQMLAGRQRPGSDWRVTLCPIPNRIGLPVIAAVVTDGHSGLTTLGLAARHTPEQAAEKALLEGFGLLESAWDMQRPDGGFWQAHRDGGAGIQAIKPIRDDRRYLDSYRADFRDVTDLFCQLQVQLDPRAAAQCSSRWTTEPVVGWTDIPSIGDRDRHEYVRRLGAAGFEPFAVDLATRDVAAAGWSAVRVVVPGLVPNFPTAFPPLGRRRVCTEPVALGWRAEPLKEDGVFAFPMPYA